MGDAIDVEGLTAAGRLWEKGQRQDDEATRRAWEGVSGRMFLRAIGIRQEARDPMRPLPFPDGRRRPGERDEP